VKPVRGFVVLVRDWRDPDDAEPLEVLADDELVALKG
jgi:hypothetical protein